ncbi:MAG TPA: hypothetical protein VIC62_17130 [Nakamurella sp.]|jgi:hypothetical protein
MHRLSSAAVLDLWDHGSALSPAGRGLAALSLAEATPPNPTPGHRDALLLDLYSATYGPVFDAIATCPRCGAALDVEIPVAELILDPPTVSDQGLRTADGAVSFRLPDARDLAEVTAADELFERCVGQAVAPAVRAEIERLMAEADPGAELELTLSCAACGHDWCDVLDPVAFFWAATTVRAGEVAGQVALLARAYGWSEPDILSMTDRRRRLYLEAIDG